MLPIEDEKRIQGLIKKIKAQKIIKSLDDLEEAIDEILEEAKEKKAITAADIAFLKEPHPFIEPHDKSAPAVQHVTLVMDILSKLPEEDTAALLLGIGIYFLCDLKTGNSTAAGQKELFPLFRSQKFVELKKEFALNFGGLDKIENDYKHLLKDKLTNGLTLQEHLNKVRDWFNTLSGEDLGNWLKLFAYVKAVKEFAKTEKNAISFREASPGRYSFSIKQNKDFFSFFIRPDKTSGQFTTKAKDKFLKWLYDNQKAIEFPMLMNGKVWNLPMRIYEYAENVSNKEIYFTVDTNILESEFKDYVSITIDEIDAISEAWETIAEADSRFSRTCYRLNSFVDVPLKFLLVLKTAYSRKGDYKNESNGFSGNIQRFSKETLDLRLGSLGERVKKHLLSLERIRTNGKSSKVLGEIENLIYETAFAIAKKMGWIIFLSYAEGIFKFNLNAGYFDRRHTAKRLKAPENP